MVTCSIETFLKAMERGNFTTSRIWFFDSQFSAMVITNEYSAWWLEFDRNVATMLVAPTVQLV